MSDNERRVDATVYSDGRTVYCHAVAQPTTRADLADALASALRDLRGAVCGETGFAQCVRDHSGTAYPWPALGAAEEAANAVLAAYEGRK